MHAPGGIRLRLVHPSEARTSLLSPMACLSLRKPPLNPLILCGGGFLVFSRFPWGAVLSDRHQFHPGGGSFAVQAQQFSVATLVLVVGGSTVHPCRSLRH